MNNKVNPYVQHREIRFLVRVGLSSLILFLVTAVCTGSAYAQRTSGSLVGLVTDTQGAVVTGATVTITNQDTGVAQNTTTTSGGTFAFPSILPGKYTVAVESTSFKKSVRTNVNVYADQQNQANVTLSPGTATESIEVSAATEMVQSTSSTLTNNYDSRQVVDLPNAGGALNGSPLNLAILAPNAIAQPGGVVGTGGSIGGTRPRENNFVIDGVDDNNLGVTGNNTTVIPDAVAEFNLVTNQFSAEYGRSSGG